MIMMTTSRSMHAVLFRRRRPSSTLLLLGGCQARRSITTLLGDGGNLLAIKNQRPIISSSSQARILPLPLPILLLPISSTGGTRCYSSSSSILFPLKKENDEEKKKEANQKEENNKPNNDDENLFDDKRIRGIIVNPDSVGYQIMPGNLMKKYNKRTRKTRELPVEFSKGYFWMIKDLVETNNKPTLSNTQLIDASEAQYFPFLLAGVKTLKGERVELPEYFLRKNRSEDEHAQCTLVAISGRDHGYNHTQTWTQPFRSHFAGNHRVEIQHLHITEGWFSSNLLAPMITKITKTNTPPSQYDTTLVCFRNNLEEFRDTLRIHNVMAGYIFLLDGIGRIRFAGSGEATPEEIQQLLQFAKELIPNPKQRRSNRNKRQSKR